MKTTTTVDIDRSAAEVFAYIADMANNPNWQSGMRACTWTTEPPIRVGSRYDQEAAFLGRPIVSRFEVVEYVEGERIRIQTYESTFPLDITRRVEALGEGRCRVTAEVGGEPTGLFALFGPLMAPMVKRSVSRDYAALKAILEAR